MLGCGESLKLLEIKSPNIHYIIDDDTVKAINNLNLSLRKGEKGIVVVGNFKMALF